MRKLTFKTLIATVLLLCSTTTIFALQPKTTKVACVGDSITFGSGIKERNKYSYPAQLDVMLGDRWDVKNFGVGGATLLKKGNKPYWKLKAFKDAKNFQPDIVIIMLGTNDSKPNNWKHKADFESNYIEMVKIFQNLESKPVVWICYPIPVFADRWGINDKTVKDEIIPLVDTVSKKTGAKVINLYKPLTGKPELVSDKIHPNPAGSKIMSETILKQITNNSK